MIMTRVITFTVKASGDIEDIASEKETKTWKALSEIYHKWDGEVFQVTESVVNSTYTTTGSDTYGDYNNSYADKGIIVSIYYRADINL